jgi:hypothetical protein
MSFDSMLPALLIFAAAGLMAESAAGAADMPDPRLTPGAVASSDAAEVCESDGRPGSAYSRAHREMNQAQRRGDFARYGIPWSDHRFYEDDHLVPLCLGGADTAANRWPQPRSGEWNSYRKDRLESYACRNVCTGSLSLGEAQRWFLAPADWRDAYRRIFGKPP